MKDRVREAIFNLLGPAPIGKHAIDLFAGTGALAFEALSRGALRASLIEQHFPTASVIRQNAALLQVVERCEVYAANTFIWAQRFCASAATDPWLVFCSPPYAFYVERQAEMLELIGTLAGKAPPGSVLVVESDERFKPELLPQAGEWDVRAYPPAVVSLWRNGRDGNGMCD